MQLDMQTVQAQITKYLPRLPILGGRQFAKWQVAKLAKVASPDNAEYRGELISDSFLALPHGKIELALDSVGKLVWLKHVKKYETSKNASLRAFRLMIPARMPHTMLSQPKPQQTIALFHKWIALKRFITEHNKLTDFIIDLSTSGGTVFDYSYNGGDPIVEYGDMMGRTAKRLLAEIDHFPNGAVVV